MGEGLSLSGAAVRSVPQTVVEQYASGLNVYKLLVELAQVGGAVGGLC